MKPSSLVCAALVLVTLASGCDDDDSPPPNDPGMDASQEQDAASTVAADCFIAYAALPNPALTSSEGGGNILQADYATKEEFTLAVQTMYVSRVLTALGIDPLTVETQVAPGGYSANSFPSLYSRYETESDAECDRLGAALGYAFRQQSSLVFRHGTGETGHASIKFAEGELNGTTAHSFFVHAIDLNSNLQGGYSSFDDELIFINLRSPQGYIYSGLQDPAYLAAFEEAASTYTAHEVTFSSDTTNAHLVENNWLIEATGSVYLELLDLEPAAEAALDSVRTDYETFMDAEDAELANPT